MLRSTGACAVAALLVSLTTTNAAACGESLFHVGKGVTFREYTAPLPGKILIVTQSEGGLIMAQRLQAAGHDVHVVADAGQVGAELGDAGNRYDVVLALFRDRQTIEEQTRQVASTAVYLPVAQEGTPEVGQAEQVTRYALSTDDSVKNFLKSIHRTLKARA
jgi:hypothetical protein